VKVAVVICGHIIVNDDIDSLNIDSTAHKVSSHQDSKLEIFEIRVILNPVLLGHAAMDANRGELLFLQKTVQNGCSLNGLHKNDRLKL
jgi:hypothetical protein